MITDYELLGVKAVVFVDKFAYTYNLVCKKHKTIGRFCDEVCAEWRESKVEFDACDDCYLGQLAIELASPIGFSDKSADIFKEAISFCKGASYQFKTATPYAKPAPTAAALGSEMSVSYNRSYTLGKGEDCNTVARSQNVSTLDLVQNNGIDINCAVMPKQGAELCLNRPCDTYTIQ